MSWRRRRIEYYRWCLDKLVMRCPEWPDSVEQVASAWDSPTLNRVSRGNVERGLRIIMSWAEKHHSCPNVLRDTKKMSYTKTLPRVFQEDGVAAVWDACDSAQERAWFALLLDTGIRLGELACLRWPEVGPASLTVKGKTGPRVVPVSSSVREMLTGLGDEAHIWVSRNGPMTRVATPKRHPPSFRPRRVDRSQAERPHHAPHLRHPLHRQRRQHLFPQGNHGSYQHHHHPEVRALGRRDDEG